MDKSRWGVHETHCCALHGCKYGDNHCPVANGQIKQTYTCEYCKDDGFKNVEQIDEYLNYQEQVKKAKENGYNAIMVNVDFLDKLLNHRH